MISIIMPTLNEEKVIGKTLARLKKELKKTKYEIIVSDGKSHDRTAQIARKYADKVVLEKGPGKSNIAKGRNHGARHAKGEYLVFIDADVYIPSPDEFFEKAISDFKQNKNLTGLVTMIKVRPELATFADRFFFGLLNNYVYVLNKIFHSGAAPGEFQMIRASSFKKLKGYDERIIASEDFEIFNRLAKIGQTKMERKLIIYHDGRRAHKIGWPKLLSLWLANGISVFFFKRSVSKEWEQVR